VSARRLDWHVLLPGPRPAASGRWLLLGGADADLAATAVELGLADSATSAWEEGERAAVVGILHGADEPIERGIRALAPGGILYWEVDRTSVRRAAWTPGRARRLLRRAGLTPVATYWVGPAWAHATRYLPLDSPAPLTWYLATVAVATGPVSAALHAILRALARAPALAELVAPRFAVVAVAAPAPAQRCPAILADAAVPARIRASPVPPVLVSGGAEAWSRITLLAFDGGAPSPGAVVKVARRAEDDAATRREHEVLAVVRERLDDRLKGSVPEPIALLGEQGRMAIVQGSVAGVSALARLRRWPQPTGRGRRDLALTAEWLASLHARTARLRAVPGSPAWLEHVDAPLERFASCFEVGEPVVRLLERLRAHAAAAASGLPIVTEHRDLGPWNVLIDDGRIRVIDWEAARDGPAMTDLVYAILHWSFVANGATSEADRRSLVRGLLAGAGGPPGEQVRGTLHRYGDAVGVDRQLIPSLVVLTLAGQALDRHDRLAGAGEAAGNRYVGYVEEVARFDEAWLTAGALTRSASGARR
jgi:aminoglycoside phosphotransferase (APT) family kinase protein